MKHIHVYKYVLKVADSNKAYYIYACMYCAAPLLYKAMRRLNEHI